jgi:hypothetical protein
MPDLARWRPKLNILFQYGTDWEVREHFVVGSRCVVTHHCDMYNKEGIVTAEQCHNYDIQEDITCLNCLTEIPKEVQEAWELYNMSQIKRGE